MSRKTKTKRKQPDRRNITIKNVMRRIERAIRKGLGQGFIKGLELKIERLKKHKKGAKH